MTEEECTVAPAKQNELFNTSITLSNKLCSFAKIQVQAQKGKDTSYFNAFPINLKTMYSKH